MSELDAFQVIDIVSAQITMDELMRRCPDQITEADRRQIIRLERAKRAAWQLKQEKKKDKQDETS